MTLIIGAVTKDCVVIVGDGNATSMDNQLLERNDFQKVFELKDTIHFGLAAAGITDLDILYLTNGARNAIDFSMPFTVYEIAVQYGNFVRNLFKYKHADFSIDFVFGGFDHDPEGIATVARLFTLDSESDYQPKLVRGRQIYYAPVNAPKLQFNNLRNDNDYLLRLLFGGLKRMNMSHQFIGGRAIGVSVSRTNSEFKSYNIGTE